MAIECTFGLRKILLGVFTYATALLLLHRNYLRGMLQFVRQSRLGPISTSPAPRNDNSVLESCVSPNRSQKNELNAPEIRDWRASSLKFKFKAAYASFVRDRSSVLRFLEVSQLDCEVQLRLAILGHSVAVVG